MFFPCRLLLLGFALLAACSDAPPAPTAAPVPLPQSSDLRLVGARAWRRDDPPVPMFDAERLPVVRLAGALRARRDEVTVAYDKVPVPVTVDDRGEWVFLRVQRPALAITPARLEVRVHVGRHEVQRWPVLWHEVAGNYSPLTEAAALRRSGQFAEALAWLDAAGGTVSAEARHLVAAERARTLMASDRADDAIAAWRDAADAAKAARLDSLAADYLRNAVYISLIRRRFSDARAWLARSGELGLTSGDPRAAAHQDYYEGLLAQPLGDFRRAAEHLERAQRAAAGEGADAEWVMMTEMLADLRDVLGQQRAALDLAHAALRHAEAHLPPGAGQARLLANVGFIEMRAMVEGVIPADWAALDARFERAVALNRDPRDPGLAGTLQVNQAEVAAQAGDTERARQLLAAFRESDPDARHRARPAAELLDGDLALRAGDRVAARRAFEQAMALGQEPVEGEASEPVWRATYGLGRVLRDEGRESAALEAFGRASAVVDVLARRTGLRADRAPFLAERRRLAEDTLALRLARRETDEAFRVADAAHARVVRTLEAHLGVQRLDAAQRAEWERLAAAYFGLRDAHEQLAEQAGPRSKAGQGELQRSLAAARAAATLAFDEAAAFLERAQGEPPRPWTRSELSAALGPGEALVSFHPVGPRRVAFVVDADGLQVVEEALGPVNRGPAAGALAEEAPQVAGAASDRGALRAHLAGRSHVYVVEAGLSGQPIAEIVPEGASVSTLPYASLLLRIPPHPSGKALVVADPRLDLPHARAEGQEVATLFGATLLDGAAASRRALLAAGAGARLLHFAGHGVLDPGAPWDAHLQLAGDETLSVADVLLARLPLGLVVLDGCETGRPAALAATESISLPAAFLVAGARTVLATSRPVRDEAARRFVRSFYAAGGAQTPGAAWRAAIAASRAEGSDVGSAFHLAGRP